MVVSLGLSFYRLTSEGSSRQAWSAGACIVLLGLTLAGPQIRNGVEAQPRACRLERHMYMVSDALACLGFRVYGLGPKAHYD